jgi:RHS repeat-associated protein
MITDQNGQVISRHDYLPFGEEITAGYADRDGLFGTLYSTTQRFTGKVRDSESGLDYFGARYYGSALGRFTSPDEFNGGIVDPFTGQDIETNTALPYADITDPQTLNKYAYVRNNPLRYTDSNGHCIEDLCIGEGALVYAGYTTWLVRLQPIWLLQAVSKLFKLPANSFRAG